ncbi:MAG: chloride channel protein [Bacteroidales bacterium]|nr:chloride channel protein [Bacteroidales bacterium]
MKKTNLLGRFLIWRLRNVTDRQFMIFLSIIIGFLVGIAAILIKYSVHGIQWLLTQSFVFDYSNYLFFVYPIIGITVVVLFTKYIIRQRIGHGIPSVLYSISKTNGRIKSHNMFSSIVASAFTVGFGGSVGLEGPTVATGAAVGSNIGRFLRLNYRQVVLLLGCACASAMAAIFKAPIAAIVFAMEVIMLDLKMSSLVPLLTASATAALTSFAFLGTDVLYQFDISQQFDLSDIIYFVILGVITGLVSAHFTRMYMFIGGLFEKIKTWKSKLLIGGALLGVVIFFLPSLYGEGYEATNACLQGDFSHIFTNTFFESYNGNIAITFLVFGLILLFKVVATSLTFGAGGIGGIFAPTLFTGAHTGLFFAYGMQQFGVNLSYSNFSLVGMAGLIAGVLHAPLTAIFLIAEITHGYDLFMPLMVTATISYATIRIFETNSVYTIQLAKRGELMTHHADKNMLKLLKVEKLIEKNFVEVNPDQNLGDLVKIISKSSRNIFPVLDEKGNLMGLVLLDHIRHIMFDQNMYKNTYVRDLMISPQCYVDMNDSMEDVAQKFQETGNFNIAVVDNGKYVGFVSRANVFSAYRNMLKDFSDD